ncbi:MAG: 3-dehydroquinate synthase [Phycisphaerales bacterium]
MTEQMRSIPVKTSSHSYDVIVGEGLLEGLGDHLAPRFGPGRRAFLVYDAGLPDELVIGVSRSLAHRGFHVSAASVQASETQKTLGTLANLLVDIAESRHERDEPVVALGGGIVGDVAGFLAATYRRGVPIVQCPTTLLAMVDASVGGKAGVNLLTDAGLLKNMVGAFHQPDMVFADIGALSTLPDRQFRSGLAECLKHAMLSADAGDAGLFGWTLTHAERIAARQAGVLTELIARNVAVKAFVVSDDEREESSGPGGRALLNLGHTFAHAIEPLPGLTLDRADGPLLHGEAVALGLRAAATCAARADLCDDDLPRIVEAALRALSLPVEVGGLPASSALLDRMGHDKKVQKGRLRLVLPSGHGLSKVVPAPPVEAVIAGLDSIRA